MTFSYHKLSYPISHVAAPATHGVLAVVEDLSFWASCLSATVAATNTEAMFVVVVN